MFNPKTLQSLYRKMCVLVLMLLGLGMMLNLPQAQAQVQGGGGFDHAATAFPLSGSHEQVRCETCHIKGIFKSTPKACASCHVVGNQRDAVAPSTKHIAMSNPPITTPLACDACHNTSTFSAAQFNHSLVQKGFCQVCHNGVRAQGLSANHIDVGGISCDSCHSSSAFIPVPLFNHDGFLKINGVMNLTTCATCHDGRIAKGKPANHLPRSDSASCGSSGCHINSTLNGFSSFAGGQIDHKDLTTGCVECHGPSITGSTFAGVTSIVVMPPISPAGPNSHIPSSTTCESCHLASLPVGWIPGNAAQQAPGSAFATPAPTNLQIHAGVTGGCSNCHDTGMVWMSMSQYPIAPSTLTTGADYHGFHSRPVTAASTYSVADRAHPTTGDCSTCHTGTAYFSGTLTPANHIPYATAAQCTSCHTSADFSVMPTLTNIHANAPSTTANCAQCHAASVVAGFAIPAANFTIKGPPTNHMPITTACETCHVGAGSSMAATPVADGALFSGSKMSHVGITKGCEACHGPTITGASFAGVTSIVVMPRTSPAGASSHIPSSTTCETCHLDTAPAGLVAANASKATGPGTLFLRPVPTTAQIHNGVTGGCNSCHDTGMVWMSMSQYPIAPTTLTAGAQYTGFHSRPVSTGSAYSVADAAHPTTGDCSQCHSGTTYFSATDKPANHIPYATTAQCTSCHTSADYAVMPTLANIHANAPSTTANCAQCHAASVVAGFAIPAANFVIVGPPTNHMPITTACETCHVGTGSSMVTTPVPNGAKFSSSKMSHIGITTGCVDCHGPTITGSSFAGVSSIVVMPRVSPAGASSHIPSSTTCETCHLGTTPAGLVAANASKATGPGTLFLTPAPTTAQIHTGITGSCNSCHDTGMVWMSMSKYPIAPSVKTTGAQYTGFHSRPVTAASTYSVADAAHPTTGDCSTCHSSTAYFSATDKPANHIPYATTAQCTSCHTSTDYAVMPTLANIHANAPSTTANCAQCHAASVVAGFAIPAANFVIVGPPTNHMPITTACETCHVGAGSSVVTTPVPNGAKFSASKMSHTGITTGCVACHGPTITGASFAGVTSIVVMPRITPAGVSSHIPSSTTCETCHLGTTPAGLVAANATKATGPGTAFLTPAPTTAQIHTGITSGCNSCHDTGLVWMSMSQYPIAPSVMTTGANYTGFHSRPVTAASTFSVADAAHPTTGDCSTCHAGTAYFSGTVAPANHIPFATAAQCVSCHTSSDYAVMPTLANIHANAPSTTVNCAQCHAASVVAGFAIPAANFVIVGPPTNHMPITTACETCHVGAGSSVVTTPVPNGAKFSASKMSHTGITTGCVTCHGPTITGASFAGVTSIVVMPVTSPAGATAHIPSSTTCESCHLATAPAGLVAANASKATGPGTLFLSPAPTTAQIHTGITGSCNSCHDTGMVWMSMSQYPIAPSVLTAGANYTGFHSRPVTAASTYSVADAAHPTTGDCSTCHSSTAYFSATDKPANHIPYATTAQCTSCHTSADYAVMPTLANIHANAPSTTANCAQCHAASVVAGFAIPAANFVIVGPPTNHMPITTACETCHVGAGSSVVTTPVPNGAKFSASKMSHTGITTGCAACHGPTITGASFAGVTSIVVMPRITPAGVSSHIPSSTTCETCHLGTTPAGLVAANATKATGPGTAFLTPAPTTAQIHTGITSGCNSCHDTGLVWMSMSQYPIAPSVMTTGANYTGFHSRPVTAASTFSVADAAHPTTGDCSTCHTGTAYFSGAAKPNGHIPTTLSCATCHIQAGDYSVAGLATNAILHTGISTGCITCHTAGTGKGPFAGCTTQAACTSPPPLSYQPKMMPLLAGSTPTSPSASTHVPAEGIACEKCHSPTVFTNFSGMNMKGNTPAHVAVGSVVCITCHEGTPAYKWYGVTIVTRAVGHEKRKAGEDCISCHTKSYSKWSGAAARVRPLMRGAAGTISQRFLPGAGLTAGVLGGDSSVFSHAGVTGGQCQTCHNGQLATGLPPVHTQTRLSCDNCHRTTAWKPAQFSHQGVLQGQCLTCHNNVAASGRPAGHFVTTRSCDTCHKTVAWVPVAYTHVSPLYQVQPGSSSCVACHVTNGEIIPRQMRGNNRPRPVPVHTGP